MLLLAGHKHHDCSRGPGQGGSSSEGGRSGACPGRLGVRLGALTGGVAAHGGLGAGVVGELEHRALAVGAGRDGHNVLRVLNRHDDARRQLQLLPGLAQVEDEDAVVAAAVHVALHGGGAVLGAQVRLRAGRNRRQQRAAGRAAAAPLQPGGAAGREAFPAPLCQCPQQRASLQGCPAWPPPWRARAWSPCTRLPAA